MFYVFEFKFTINKVNDDRSISVNNRRKVFRLFISKSDKKVYFVLTLSRANFAGSGTKINF